VHTKFWQETPKGRDHWEEMDVDSREYGRSM
jgi:hypothetical protein